MEDLIKGTRRLLDIAAQSKLLDPPSLSYISSIGIYQRECPGAIISLSTNLILSADYREPVPAPEAPVLDPKTAVQTGYMESKWVAERLVQIAGAKLALKTNVIRVGLLTGGVNGSWDTSHWLPALVQSAMYVGCLPEGDDVSTTSLDAMNARSTGFYRRCHGFRWMLLRQRRLISDTPPVTRFTSSTHTQYRGRRSWSPWRRS